MGKIDKLNRDIESYRKDIVKYEDKVSEARELHKSGRIDKDKWTRARHKYQEKIRNAQIAIRRKEKARMQIEKGLKENEEEKKEKEKEKEKGF